MTHAISAAGLALIQRFEGFRAEPTQMPDGNWVVGHGHVRRGEPGEPINHDEAASLLAADVAPVEHLVNVSVTRALTQSQFDALVSFAISVGAEAFGQSQVLRRVNAGELVAAACAMDAWRKSDVSGELAIVDVLVRRRAAEKAMFLDDIAIEGAPSPFLRAKLDYAASILGAPISYAPAPVVGSIPVVQAQPEPAQRLAEIMKSEPATEALLLTQPIAEDFMEGDEEIVTAHAKPVARPLDTVREATRRAYAAQQDALPKKGWNFFNREDGAPIFNMQPEINVDRRIRELRSKPDTAPRFVLPATFDNVGLVALTVFGVVLVAIGALLAFNGQGVDLMAGAAVAAPGLAAAGIGAYGLWRAAPEAAANA